MSKKQKIEYYCEGKFHLVSERYLCQVHTIVCFTEMYVLQKRQFKNLHQLAKCGMAKKH